MAARKKWRLIYPGHPQDVDEFPTERQAYEFVDELRSAWAAGGPTSSLTVQVNEGRGWRTCDHIDFATETAEETA